MKRSISITKGRGATCKTYKGRNTTLDMVRIVLACLVVYIHLNTHLYNRTELDGVALVLDDIIRTLARMAVPIFFAISGYCLCRQNQVAERMSIKRSLRHLALLIMGCFIIYITVGIVLNGPAKTATRFTSNQLFQFTLFNQTGGILGTAAPWFLLALTTCYITYYFYPYFCKKQKYLLTIAALLYLWAISISPVYGGVILDKEPAMLFRSYLGLGLPFFSLGYFCHRHQSRIHNVISNQTVKFTALAFILYFIEQVIYLSGGHRRSPMEISIIMPLVVLGVLMLAAQHPKLLAKTKFPAWSAKHSLYLYIGHAAVISILSKYLFDNNPPNNLRYYKVLLLYIAVIVITLIISWAWVMIKKVVTSIVTRQTV